MRSLEESCPSTSKLPLAPRILLHQLGPMAAVFAIVLVWHGPRQWNYAFWVLLSDVGLCIERVGAGVVARSEWFAAVGKTVGEKGVVRLKAVGMLATVIPGLFLEHSFVSKKEMISFFIEIFSVQTK